MTDARSELRAALADRYRIGHELGRGGMATVYLAHDVRHDRPVALKVLHAELAAALGPERFQREIRFAARLQHPHILTVLDFRWRHKRPVALKVLHAELAATLGPERFQREIELAARLQHPHVLTVHDSGEVPAPAGAPPILWFTMPFVDAARRILLGLAWAYMGRKAEAVREGERAVAFSPIGREAYQGAYFMHQLARIYTLVGEPDRAIDLLERLLAMPYYLSPVWLRIDPTLDPLRKHPRFQRLVEQVPTS